MSIERIDPRLERAKELAGSTFQEMMQSKENALALLSASDRNVREAAILVCEAFWKCNQDRRLVEACYSIADSDADESVRISAINSLGRILSATRASDASQYLARLVVSSTSSNELQLNAYWALRDIQFGQDDEDFFKGTISTVKSILRTYPGKFSEDEIKQVLTPQPGFPENYWDSADQIDLEFVKRFLSKKG